jgi:hypothetical protein
MEKTILLSFTDGHKYQLEFSPTDFWRPFAQSYTALPWIEQSEGRLAVVAENYSYLLDLLVQARLFNLSSMTVQERYG